MWSEKATEWMKRLSRNSAMNSSANSGSLVSSTSLLQQCRRADERLLESDQAVECFLFWLGARDCDDRGRVERDQMGSPCSSYRSEWSEVAPGCLYLTALLASLRNAS